MLGDLDDRPSVTGTLVTPVVGLVDAPPAYRLDEREVREVFEVPLARLLEPGVMRCEWWDASRIAPELRRRPLADLDPGEVDAARGRYQVWFFDVAPDRVIWGLTGRIVRELLDRAFRAG